MMVLDRIADLECRQETLENELAEALATASANNPIVVELKSRVLYLKGEINRLRREVTRQQH